MMPLRKAGIGVAVPSMVGWWQRTPRLYSVISRKYLTFPRAKERLVLMVAMVAKRDRQTEVKMTTMVLTLHDLTTGAEALDGPL